MDNNCTNIRDSIEFSLSIMTQSTHEVRTIASGSLPSTDHGFVDTQFNAPNSPEPEIFNGIFGDGAASSDTEVDVSQSSEVRAEKRRFALLGEKEENLPPYTSRHTLRFVVGEKGGDGCLTQSTKRARQRIVLLLEGGEGAAGSEARDALTVGGTGPEGVKDRADLQKRRELLKLALTLLYCSVCLEPQKNILTLECGHAICVNHVHDMVTLVKKKVLMIKAADATTVPIDSNMKLLGVLVKKEVSYAQINCPVCRQPTRINGAVCDFVEKRKMASAGVRAFASACPSPLLV